MENIAMYFINNYLDVIDINILGYILKNKELDIFKKYILPRKTIRCKIIASLIIPFSKLKFNDKIYYLNRMNARFYMENIFKINNERILFTKNDVIDSCKFYVYTEEILYTYFKNMTTMLTDEILFSIVSRCTVNQFKKILDLNILNYQRINYKILNKVIHELNYDLIEYLLKFNVKQIDDFINIMILSLKKFINKNYNPNAASYHSNSYYYNLINDLEETKIKSCIEQLVLYGCKLTYENIKDLTKLKISIPNFRKI